MRHLYAVDVLDRDTGDGQQALGHEELGVVVIAKPWGY
jgi:hypothetical protein